MKNMFLYKKRLTLARLFFLIMMCISLSCHAASHTKAINRPLKILFVVGHFPAPSQVFILNIITGLIDRGHDVSIFSFHKDSKYINIHPHVEKYKLWNLVTYEKFKKKLPDYDIVFCQFGYVGKKFIAMKEFSKWLQNRKTVVCFRGSDITAHIKDDLHMYDDLFVKADLFLPVCDYFKKRLIDLGCNPHKIVVHHSAIDCSQFFFRTRKTPKNGTIQCVSVCRLVKKKGIDYALKAIAQVVQKYPDIHFTIVGDGEERKSLERLTEELQLQEKVTFYGWGMQDEVVAILNRSHIFLLPSRTDDNGNEEGIPNALKEAMATGLISIATWHAGNAELIQDEVSGFLVLEKSVTQLANAIEYVIENPQLWESVGRAARKKVKDEFETKKSVKKLEEIFYQLLGLNKTEEDYLNSGEC